MSAHDNIVERYRREQDRAAKLAMRVDELERENAELRASTTVEERPIHICRCGFGPIAGCKGCTVRWEGTKRTRQEPGK